MKMLLAVLALCVLALPVDADFPPLLQPHATKFETDRATLNAWSEAQLKPTRDRYLAALTAAQKAAVAAAKTGDLAAIGSEIEGVGTGGLTDAFPPDLPRSLAQDRRNYLAALAVVTRTIPPRQRDLATSYLQTLAALEPGALNAHDEALIEALAKEKTRVLALVEALGGGQKNSNVATNGDFTQGQAGSFPPGWKAEAGDVAVTDATLMTEGNEKFVRFRRLQALRRANLNPDKVINIPAKAKWVECSVRLRVKGLVPGTSYDTLPGLHVTGRDARGEEAGGAWATTKQDTAWKRFTARFALLPTAKTLRITAGPFGAAGVIDLDDIDVKFQ